MGKEGAMPCLGAHMSIQDGLHMAVERGHSIGCEAIQVFTRNASRWKSKKRTPEELDLYRQALARTSIHLVVAHAIYLINLASPEDDVRAMSNDAFREELGRCHEAGIPYLVIHPGSHKGRGLETGMARIAQGIHQAYAEHPEYTVVTLLENTAGQGDTIGRTFEELAGLTAQIVETSRIGYCFDTAHALASGYELRTREGYEETFARLDRILGLDKLYCFHLNDSKYDLGDERDRHQHIGQGYLGVEAFRMLLNDPRFAELPMLLETPKSEDMHEDMENLALLRSLIPSGLPS
jgi:deoxyribonuclease-4